MCGIVGYINLKNNCINNTDHIIKMLRIQKHRGPDDSGIQLFSLKSGTTTDVTPLYPVTINGNFEGVLGFNRLSILDLSSNGHQPMVSADNNVVLAMNGEIYNAFDFKSELEEWGYKFKSTTDTEVVLALYLKYGFDGMLCRLNGMYAIVIADLTQNQIFITRDRFGIKPMYYVNTGNILAFSSELKSFRYLEDFKFQLVEEQLDEYLLFRNNLDGTLFKDIHSLTPGSYISFKNGGKPVLKRFFELNDYFRSGQGTSNPDKYLNMLEEWLGRSVSRQLMSDVKLGCQLSGGIDSSLVTWLANRKSEKGNFEAVSIIFSDLGYSEEKYINNVANVLAIPSHKFLLDSAYYYENIEKATWHLESPINHPNTVAIYKLSQCAKEYVTVLLSGEGADEVFGGYTRFYDIAYPFRSRKLLHEIKKNLKHPLCFMSYFDPENRAIMATSFMSSFLAGALFPGFDKERAVNGRRSLYKTLTGSKFDKQVKYEMQSFLPDLLIRQDKMSMAHSIENRVPFLDNEVVENSFTIPERSLLPRKSPEGFNTEKYLLKKLTATTFGNSFAFRNKMGFGIPVKEFFLNNKFQGYLHDKVMPSMKCRGIFNYKLTSEWLSDISALKYHEIEALWVVISFEIWASIYLDNNYDDWNTRD
jgi:asparagine synthase (glutamine-hydrolysing)